MMKGVYTLVLLITRNTTLMVGSLGHLSFEKGFWVYVGSAMGRNSSSIENRLSRHFSKTKKTHWHIDYLLNNTEVLIDALWAQSEKKVECVLAKRLAERMKFVPGPSGFGSSDCENGCGTHLFRYLGEKPPYEELEDIFREIALVPHRFKDMKRTNR